jgi:hypothetical protein
VQFSKFKLDGSYKYHFAITFGRLKAVRCFRGPDANRRHRNLYGRHRFITVEFRGGRHINEHLVCVHPVLCEPCLRILPSHDISGVEENMSTFRVTVAA